jgi:hypothetical protein
MRRRYVSNVTAGAPGIYGMGIEELRPWLYEHWPEVRSQLDAGIYP